MFWVGESCRLVKIANMSVFGKMMRRAMVARCHRIERAVARAVEEQYATLNRLLARGRYTHFGQYEGLKHVRTPEQFARVVRRFDYASFAGYVERMRGGERDVTTAGRVEMFARSSGTSARSKYIPVTLRALWHNHLRGMADTVALYLAANPSSRLFDGRTLTMAGECHR